MIDLVLSFHNTDCLYCIVFNCIVFIVLECTPGC